MLSASTPTPAQQIKDRAQPSLFNVLLGSHGDALVLLGSALYMLLFLRHPWFSEDVGYIAAGAERITRGQVMFRDFFSEIGPGTYYLQAAVFKLLGVGLPAVNVLVWLTGLGISWLTYRLSKLTLEGPLALLPSFFFMGVCYPTNYALSHHWTGTFCFLLMLLCMAGSIGRAESQGPRGDQYFWLVAGLLAALTLVCMQPKGVMALLLGPAYLVAEKVFGTSSWKQAARRARRMSLWFLAGFGAVLAAVALFFAMEGAARDWLYDNFLFLPTRYWPYVNPSGAILRGLTHPFARLLATRSPTYLLFVLAYYSFTVVGPVLAIAGAIWCLRNFRDFGSVRARLLLLYIMGSFGAFLSELHSLDFSHFVAGGILLAPVLLSIYQFSLRRLTEARRWLVLGAVIVGIFIVLGSTLQVVYAQKRDTPVPTRRGTFYVASEDAGVLGQWIGTIQNRVAPGDETFFFSYDASLYFLTATRNPTRFDYVLPAFHTPSQFAEVIKTLLLRRPRFIFDFSDEEQLPEPTLVTPHPVEEFLQSAASPYQLQSKVESMKVWAVGR